jgi:hypothetical protein
METGEKVIIALVVVVTVGVIGGAAITTAISRTNRRCSCILGKRFTM